MSFVALLTALRAGASVITRDWWLSEVDDDVLRWSVGQGFDERFGGSTGAHLDPDVIQTDLEELARRMRPIKKYLDKNLAHKDPKPTKTIPTLTDLDDAIDYLGELFRKYYLLLTRGGRHPVGQVFAYDWVAPFRVAWLPDRPSSAQ